MSFGRESFLDLGRALTPDPRSFLIPPTTEKAKKPVAEKRKKKKSSFTARLVRALMGRQSTDSRDFYYPGPPLHGAHGEPRPTVESTTSSEEQRPSATCIPDVLNVLKKGFRRADSYSETVELTLFHLLCGVQRKAELRSLDTLPKQEHVQRDLIEHFVHNGDIHEESPHKNEVVRFRPFSPIKPLPEPRKKSVIYISEFEEPVDFLMRLGFNVEEAGYIAYQEIVRGRLKYALYEARVWVKQITIVQATLLYLLSYVLKNFAQRYFPQIVEAIVNNRITDARQLDAVIMIVEGAEAGVLRILPEIGTLKIFEHILARTKHRMFIRHFTSTYIVAYTEARARGSKILSREARLLEYLCNLYRPELEMHLALLSEYIGQGLFTTKYQIHAAVVYLQRMDASLLDIREFETFLGFAGIEILAGIADYIM